MSALLWVPAALLALLLLVALAPWHVRFTGRTSPLQVRVELRVLAGLGPPIPLPLRRGGKGGATASEGRTKKRSRKRRKRAMPAGLADLISGLLRAIEIRGLRISGRFGFDDPADTGLLWGRITPFVYGLDAPTHRFALAPDFSGPCLDLEASGDVVVLPLRLLKAGAAFGWTNARAR